jgi:hypothetical protein
MNKWEKRVAAADWAAVTAEVDEYGCALLPQLLTAAECARLAALWDKREHFRATVNLRRHRFGDNGDYHYFAAPFPEPVQALREALYPRLLPIARDWASRLGRDPEWPSTLDEWLTVCHEVINLNAPGVDHTGGEFLLVEQRPRAQSRGTATLVPQGHGLVFTTRDRPVRSARGWSASPVRHGVSAVRSGRRHTLGLVFHDAT